MKFVSLLALFFVCFTISHVESCPPRWKCYCYRADKPCAEGKVMESAPPVSDSISAAEKKALFPFTYTVYKDKAGEWRWRLQAANHKIIADSGEGYKNKKSCLHGIDLNKAAATASKTVVK